MKITWFRLLLGAVPLSIAVSAPVFLSSASRAQDRQPPAKAEYIGSERCILCHRGLPEGSADDQGILQFIRFDEGTYWASNDIHRAAFDVLKAKGGLGERMGKLLGIEDVSKSPQCLSCHAVDLQPVAWDQVHKRKYDEDEYGHSFGVSCEACHGSASRWEPLHTGKKWRLQSAEEKKSYGMTDLRDPVECATLCTSCHVGDWKLGRVVTHEMYAAGHPPLPPIEVATFIHDQPMHHRPPSETPVIRELARTDPEKCWDVFHYRAEEMTNVRQLAVGSLTTFRRTMQMLVDEAGAPDYEGKSPTLDWMHFDCYACHHDLEVPSWRQRHGFRGVPGRPQIRSWPVPVARVIARHADAALGNGPDKDGLEKSLNRHLGKLIAACDARPFGKQQDLREAGQALVQWADDAISAVGKVRYDRQEAWKLMTMLVEDTGGRGGAETASGWLDPDGAQHLVWALEILRRELAPDNADVLAEFKSIGETLPLHIRQGQKLQPLEPHLDARLKRTYQFQPGSLLESFNRLGKLIPPRTP